MNYIATKHLTNSAGLGITEIDHFEEKVSFDLVTDSRRQSFTRPWKWVGEQVGFTFRGAFHSFGEFIRAQ